MPIQRPDNVPTRIARRPHLRPVDDPRSQTRPRVRVRVRPLARSTVGGTAPAPSPKACVLQVLQDASSDREANIHGLGPGSTKTQERERNARASVDPLEPKKARGPQCSEDVGERPRTRRLIVVRGLVIHLRRGPLGLWSRTVALSEKLYKSFLTASKVINVQRSTRWLRPYVLAGRGGPGSMRPRSNHVQQRLAY